MFSGRNCACVSMKVVCDNCGKDFRKKRNYVEKRTKHNFCTQKCFGEYKAKHRMGVEKSRVKDRSTFEKLVKLAKERRIHK